MNTANVRIGTVRTGNEKSEKQTCVWDLKRQSKRHEKMAEPHKF